MFVKGRGLSCCYDTPKPPAAATGHLGATFHLGHYGGPLIIFRTGTCSFSETEHAPVSCLKLSKRRVPGIKWVLDKYMLKEQITNGCTSFELFQEQVPALWPVQRGPFWADPSYLPSHLNLHILSVTPTLQPHQPCSITCADPPLRAPFLTCHPQRCHVNAPIPSSTPPLTRPH